MNDWHPDAGTLHAWAEAQLPDPERRRVDAHLASCASCAAAAAEARGLIAASSRIVSALDFPIAPVAGTDAAGGVIPLRAKPARRRVWTTPWAAAAGLVMVAGIGTYLATRPESTRRAMIVRDDAVVNAATEAAPAEAIAAPPVPAPAAGSTAGAVPTATPSSPQAPRTRALRRESSHIAGRVGVVANGAEERATVAAAPRPASPLPPPPPPPPPPMPAPANARAAESVQSGRDFAGAGVRVEQVSVDGSGAAQTPVRTTTYQVRPGVNVELREFVVGPDSVAQPQARRAVGMSAATPTSPRMEASSETNAHVWFNADRTRRYVLTGPFSAAELEEMARRLGELKVVR